MNFIENLLLASEKKENDNFLYVWGNNSNGQLGLIFPTQSWTQVSAGYSHLMAIRSDGALFGWGGNTSGQLGLGDTTQRNEPTQVGTSSWTQVSTNSGFTLAIRSDGALFSWGNNYQGRLGTNNLVNYSSPVQIGTSSWIQVSAGTGTAGAIRSDGALFTWGRNQSGQLGDGTTTTKSSPVQIGTSSWTQVSAGFLSMTAIREDGLLFAWGRNGNGQLGLDGLFSRSSPVQVGSDTWNKVSMSPEFSLALRSDNKLHVAGRYPYGVFPDYNWTQVSSGFRHTLAIRSDGSLFGWGWNARSTLGFPGSFFGGTGDTVSFPARIPTDQSWVSVATGKYHTLAISSDNLLFAWGGNSRGELGDGTQNSADFFSFNERSSPTQIGSQSWTSVSASTYTSAAIRADGALFTWGENGYGGLGHNDFNRRSSPTQVGTSSWTQVSIGRHHTAAIRADGALFTWGRNGYGQLGDGTTNARLSPVQIGTSSWTQVSVGAEHTTAIRVDGKLFSWGNNNTGQLGLGDTISKSSPVQVGTSSWTQVKNAHDSNFSGAIRSDGILFTWGSNGSGQLGLGDTPPRSSPTQVGTSSWKILNLADSFSVSIGSDDKIYLWGGGSTTVNPLSGSNFGFANFLQINNDNWIDIGELNNIQSGRFAVSAIRDDGILFNWGQNSGGRLGDGTSINRSFPTQIGSETWSKPMSTTNNFGSAAIDSNGFLFTWGQAAYGQLGNSSVSRSSPVVIGETLISTTTPIQLEVDAINLCDNYLKSISVGANHTAYIRSDGALFTLGLNSNGQLGDGTTFNRSSPVQIGTSSWTQVSAGFEHTSAIRSDGKLFTWGSNSFGQLGRGDIISISSPVQVGFTNWTQVSSGRFHTLALMEYQTAPSRFENRLFVWGRNNYGQLGLGDTSSRSSPNVVGSLSGPNWSKISSGGYHSAAIRSDGSLFAWGNNGIGQLGLGDRINRSSPVQVDSSVWSQVSLGISHTLAIRSDNKLFGWGSGSFGQNGLVTEPKEWNSFAAKRNFVQAIDTDGKLWAWGINYSGRIGNESTQNIFSPVQIGSSSWTSVGTGIISSHASAIRSDGALFVWGRNNIGQIGDGTLIDKSSPVQIGNESWTSVSNGLSHTIAIRSDGTLWAWGRGNEGQLGLGDTSPRSSPTQVGTSSWTQISCGYSASAAIRSDGKLFVFGQTPNGWVVGSNSPVQVGNETWTKVEIGSESILAIRSDGLLFAWGRNVFGEIGDGTSVSKSSPVQIGNDTWIDIGAGSLFSTAIRSDYKLFSWGRNVEGQLGDGSTTSRSSPVQVGTNLWSNVNVGAGGVVAKELSTNYLYAWAGIGMSGNNGGTSSTTPVLVGNSAGNSDVPSQIGNDSWSFVGSGANSNHSLGIKTDGSLFAWGLNTSGQLGDGTFSNRSSPVQIGNAIWQQVGTGQAHTIGLGTANTSICG
jgi:alpha-tubulin suppressor-like RCC1 family protein